jgi:peptidoglycan/xylan/chitin deacetylase (PgdA/CDA1 family)
VAAVGMMAHLAGLVVPLRAWLAVGAVIDPVVLVATFERRAPLWGRVVTRGRTRTPAVALTFDDGPTEPYTAQILSVLRDYDARATFFVLGARAVANPWTLRRAVAEGHEIGNHTWDHRALPLKGPTFVQDTIRRTSDAIEQIAGVRPRLFRAPFGWRNPWVTEAARREGCETIAWTVGVNDTSRPGAGVIIERSVAGLQNGAILLLHDGRSFDPNPDASQVVAALPAILREIQGRGLRMLTISELLAEQEQGA